MDKTKAELLKRLESLKQQLKLKQQKKQSKLKIGYEGKSDKQFQAEQDDLMDFNQRVAEMMANGATIKPKDVEPRKEF